MLFNSVEFFVFFTSTICGFFILGSFKQQFALGWLVICSLFFYGWWNPPFVLLILGSITFNFIVGRLLSQRRNRTLLIFGVVANLLAIGYFKYCNFFITSLSWALSDDFNMQAIILPLGISFFTFQQIAYLADAYTRQTQENNFINYALFVSFFPQLIAGPIVHHGDILPQFKQASTFRPHKSAILTGFVIFFLGLFKKVVVADGLAPYANAVFNHADEGGVVTFFEGWGGALAYSLQLYYDFSGYSDMAIGLACMLNIRLPLNFNSPYRQMSIIEFWRCWHITLSRFLRDYLYIPLGGSRKGGSMRRYANLMITMLLGGLWHGAAWNFVFWGGLHGFYLLLNHGWRYHFNERRQSLGSFAKPAMRCLSWGLTFTSVVVAWVFFRATTFDGAFAVIRGMSGLEGFVLPDQIIQLMPLLKCIPWLEGIGTLHLLGGGTLLGAVEQFSMILLFLGASIFSLNLYQMSGRQRLVLFALIFAFTIQRVFFSPAPSEFIYFQF